MPKLNTTIGDGKKAFTPELWYWYKVINVERGHSTFNGQTRTTILVTIMTPVKKIDVYSIYLDQEVTKTSRLGAHILALGEDDDKWRGKYLYYQSWGREGYAIHAQTERPEKPTERIPVHSAKATEEF